MREHDGIRRRPAYTGQPHYFQDVDPEAERQLVELVTFLRTRGLTFYEMDDVHIAEANQGQQRYITVSVSIKLA